MKKEYFDMYIQVIENMSDDKVTIYTSPNNKDTVEIMMMHVRNIMSNSDVKDE